MLSIGSIVNISIIIVEYLCLFKINLRLQSFPTIFLILYNLKSLINLA